MNTPEEVEEVFNLAGKIKKSTPYSFTYLIIREEIMSNDYSR